MSDENRIQEVLDNLDAHQTPEDVCGNDAELLRDVRARWEKMRRVNNQLDDLFPAGGPTQKEEFASPPSKIELPQIDGYDVVSVLGRGGMGVVFKAKHRKLNRFVALKMILTGRNQ
jgi:serine/threonine protein kinase